MTPSENNWPYVINLSNSIIGISTLAMPYCFKQCGIVLGILILLFSTWLTLVSCQILMKAGITSRKSSYGFLAYYTYGVSGKLAVELGMIGLQIGTLIAQIVVIGDFGPAILSKIFAIENSSNLRIGLIMFLCLCVGLPLGLLKDLRAVSRASTVCVCFYVIFIFYVLSLSAPNLLSGEWYLKVSFWKNEGVFGTLSIFAYSFGCQTQLFVLYDALPEPSLKAVNGITSSAVNLCAVAYLLMGFFGYIAFHEDDITADIIKRFPQTFIADLMKLGFVISTAITIPLIMFPCRVSLYNLLFSQIHYKPKGHDDMPAQTHIPEIHFKILTLFIVIVPMIVAIIVPNVEFILSFNGATMGTLMCFIFPAIFFLKVNKGESKGLAQIVLICGVTIMLISTFSLLNTVEKGHGHHIAKDTVKDIVNKLDIPDKQIEKPEVKASIEKDDQRKEPANPQAPDDDTKLKSIKTVGKDSTSRKKKKSVKNDDGVEEVGQEKEAVVNEDDVKKKDTQQVEEKLKEKEKQIEETALKQKDLLNKLEKQQQESKKILEAQKELMEELKDHKKEHVDSKILGQKAVLHGDHQSVLAQGQAGFKSPQNILAQNLPLGKSVQNNLGGQVPVQNNLGGQVPVQNNAGGQIPVQNNLGGQVPVQNNLGGQVPDQNNLGGKVPVQNNLGGQVPVQKNLGGQVPVQNNLGGKVPVQNNLGGQVPVQNNLGGQVPVQNNLGGQVPVQNSIGGQVPIQNNLGGQVPVQNNLGGQVPVQNNLGGQVPVQNNLGGQVPVQNNLRDQVPVQNNLNGQVPVQNNLGGQIPAQNNLGGQVPVQNNLDGQVPAQNSLGGQVPVQNIPIGKSQNQVPVQNVVVNQGAGMNQDNVLNRGRRDVKETIKMKQETETGNEDDNEEVDDNNNNIKEDLPVDVDVKNDEMRRKLRNVDDNVNGLLSRSLLSVTAISDKEKE
ncbi:putative sodium-coupled neutral amino acid transporter 10 [Patella vulgata]|uniref:putative sodium-coupled neutral amino acid transporter 10 n=1 Tax=Patella vulgata TaxID=6465 RepID=UPI00218095A6|nr:putative sodium-coupled neutral amino acid transporter 10 [Patella vulgata]XP_050391957.1 putative sodium-coupled neutral amino acid transporter 10 [Patella vulgata]XP_050391958.1 putative sodium-coupled neutral amino acid transporter 10 [Patella vulgata]